MVGGKRHWEILTALAHASAGETVAIWCFSQEQADSFREELLAAAEEHGVDPSLITVHASEGKIAGKKPDSIVVDELEDYRER